MIRKICLINPPTTSPSDGDIYFPMSLLALAGICREKNIEVELLDFDLYGKSKEDISVKEFRCHVRKCLTKSDSTIFGITSICSNLPMAIWIAKEIKQKLPDAAVIMGGAQPSATPRELLETVREIDAVVVGEGEETFRDLIENDFVTNSFSTIEGVASINEDGSYCFKARSKMITNLDSLPFPAYDLLNIHEYRSVAKNGLLISLEAGRGCPFACTFCSTSRMWKRKYRMKSVKRIFQEMELLDKLWGVQNFNLVHDNFTTSKLFIKEFCEGWHELTPRKWQWSTSSRVDCITVEELTMMAKAGLKGLFFGVETGSSKMQQVIGKRLCLNGFEEIIKHARKLGIDVTASFILGFPEEEISDINETISLAIHYKNFGANKSFFSKLSPLAGTDIHKRYAKNLLMTDYITTISPLTYGIGRLRDMIRDNPDLFSSFYHIPHPILDGDKLGRLIDFYHVVIKFVPDLADPLFIYGSNTPLHLFDNWERWNNGRPLMTDFRDRFQTFLAETIFNRQRHNRPRKQEQVTQIFS